MWLDEDFHWGRVFCCEKCRWAAANARAAERRRVFRQNLLCMQPDGEGGTRILIGRVLSLPGKEKRILESADAFCETLDELFALRDPAFSSLWPQLVARHKVIFGN